MKKIGSVILAIILAHFAAYPVGHWFDSKYKLHGWFYFGTFPGYLDGFLFSYIFLSAILVSLAFRNIKKGLLAASIAIVIQFISGAVNPQLWMSLLLLAAGLGLAWIILKLKK